MRDSNPRWAICAILTLVFAAMVTMGSTCVVIEEEPYGEPRYEDQTEAQILEEQEQEEMERRSDY